MNSKELTKRKILICIVALISIIVIFSSTSLDLLAQNNIYNFQLHQWPVPYGEGLIRNLFYNWIKIPLYIYGAIALGLLIFFRKKTYVHKNMKGWALSLANLALVPLVAVVGKDLSNMRCPYELVDYSGQLNHFRLFDFNRYFIDGHFIWDTHQWGHCFPAGHASGGYALLGLMAFSAHQGRRYLIGMFALFYGSVMAIYQMLRGAHFLSHTLTTVALSYLIFYCLELAWDHYFPKEGLSGT